MSFEFPPRRYAGTIPGRPVPFSRTRGEGRRRFNPAAYATWKDAAGYTALGIRRGGPMLEGPLGIDLVVTPDGIAFEVYELGVQTLNRLPGDLDNYAKGLLDALQRVLYKDDRQVETITVHFANNLEDQHQ